MRMLVVCNVCDLIADKLSVELNLALSLCIYNKTRIIHIKCLSYRHIYRLIEQTYRLLQMYLNCTYCLFTSI